MLFPSFMFMFFALSQGHLANRYSYISGSGRNKRGCSLIETCGKRMVKASGVGRHAGKREMGVWEGEDSESYKLEPLE